MTPTPNPDRPRSTDWKAAAGAVSAVSAVLDQFDWPAICQAMQHAQSAGPIEFPIEHAEALRTGILQYNQDVAMATRRYVNELRRVYERQAAR